MPAATIIALIDALAALAPALPEITEAVNTAVPLIRSGQPPTAAQQTAIDAGLAAAHAALQAS